MSDKQTDQNRRDWLTSLARSALVREDRWKHRATGGAMRMLGEFLSMMRCGCEFKIRTADNTSQFEYSSCGHYWVVEVHCLDWGHFDEGGRKEMFLYCIPTEEVLKEANGEDWKLITHRDDEL